VWCVGDGQVDNKYIESTNISMPNKVLSISVYMHHTRIIYFLAAVL
jgi:hypothetical protein